MIWKWLFHRKSILEVLQTAAKSLPLKSFEIRRLPVPAVSGNYFGFPITLEGGRKGEGFRFLAAIELPKALPWRVFLCHEKRKTSFKPVANLKLVTTTHARFNQTYLLLASEEARAQAVFQPYLCAKIVELKITDWQLDVSGEAAHLELLVPRLNASWLCEVLAVTVECLNGLLVSTPQNEK